MIRRSMEFGPGKDLSALNKITPQPAVAFVGYSKSGKTTVMSAVIARLTANGYRVGAIKHDVHGFTMDQPGKDTWRLKNAGAAATLISSPKGIGMVMDTGQDTPLENLLEMLSDFDVILIEGYKRALLPKIEVYRPESGNPPACVGDPHLIAVVSDVDLDWTVPCFSFSNAEGIAEFIASRVIQGNPTIEN